MFPGEIEKGEVAWNGLFPFHTFSFPLHAFRPTFHLFYSLMFFAEFPLEKISQIIVINRMQHAHQILEHFHLWN